MTRLVQFSRLAAAALALWLGALNSGLAAELIQSFDSTVVLAKNGELTVTERIRVYAEGNAINHGIYRDFPLSFSDAEGKLREVEFTLLDLTRDGKPEPHSTERLRGKTNVLRIYAGDKNAQLVPGRDYTYVIRYRTARQVRWFDGQPELNWNATGNFWNFPIQSASYRLELAGNAQPTRWTAFTGTDGAKGSDWKGAVGADGALTVSITKPLGANEGLTVVATLPQSAVLPPSAADEMRYSLADNRAWILGSIGFALVLIYFYAAWNAVGRDPKPGAIIPLFHPPKDISPSLANYIHHWGLGHEKWRAFTAGALSLAVQGLLRFEGGEGGEALTLKAAGGNSETLPQAAGERAIMTSLYANGGTLVINARNGEAVANAGSKFAVAIETENKDKFFRRNLGYVILGMAMTVAVLFAVVNYGGPSGNEVFFIIGVTLGGLLLGFYLVSIIRIVLRVNSFFTAVRAALLALFVGFWVMIAYVLLRGFVSGLLPAALHFVEAHFLALALVGGFAALNGLFLYLMRAPTALGRPVMDQLAGFKLYLQTAESNRLNLQAPEITADRFEALLPYAVALDAEKPWSDAFASAIKRAHPEDADPMRHYQPAWTSNAWSSANFGSAVASTVASASSALSNSVPVSSSSSGFSSGGGGSGGGGGGGGGGGW
ncbi:MAG: DUF2207 domain-containing protein [Betaproteobacteria bacterium]|nr:DUF2207 domain-containing protein [Betaproteobacteria bacterium]